MTVTGADLRAAQRAAASAVTQRTTRILLARQDSAGRWIGRSTNDVTLDAEAVLLREFLGISRPELTKAAAQQIRSMQQPEGNWIGGAEPGRSGDLGASVLAYLALRFAGDPPDAYHLAVAAGWIRDAGGLAAAGPLASSWLAVFGLTGWDEVRVPAPEFIYLPARYAASGGDWTGLSRQAAVSLTVIGTLRPVRQLQIDLSELRPGGLACAGAPASPRTALVSVAQRAALRKCGQWLVSWQQRAGLPMGRRPYFALSLVALSVLGHPLGHPVVAGGLGWFDSVTARPRQLAGSASASNGAAGQGRLAAMRQPPVRDTALAVQALADAGLQGDHTAIVAAGSWLLAQRITGPAEMTGPQAAPSGWSFGPDGYPAAADTAEVLLALSRIERLGMTGESAVTAAIRWLVGVQRRDGSWEHSAGITALVVQALATHSAPEARATRRGVVWLIRAQMADGSWPGPYGAAELRATADALAALLMAGVVPSKPVIRAAIEWLLSKQNPDGGWHCGAARPEHADRPGLSLPQPESDAAGTARAVAVLLAAGGGAAAGPGAAAGGAAAGGGAAAVGNAVADAAAAGADWLMRAQRADGGWSDRADAVIKPASRNPARRRGSLLPGVLLPLGALGQYASSCIPGTGVEPGVTAASTLLTGENVAGPAKDQADKDEAGKGEVGKDPVLPATAR